MRPGALLMVAVAGCAFVACPPAASPTAGELSSSPTAEAGAASAVGRAPSSASTGDAAAAVTSTSQDASGSSDPCDELVAAAVARGPIGLEKEADPPLDPTCAWRIDDAEIAALVATDDARLGPSGAAAAADLRRRLGAQAGVIRLQGRTEPSVLERALRTAEPAVAACVQDVPQAKPVLRVRVAFDTSGAVVSALTDYAITLPLQARQCVVEQLKHLRLVAPVGNETVVFGFRTRA